MNYRTVEILSETTFSSSTTKIIDLNIAQPISTLVIRINGYATSHTMAAHLMACITQIDLVDGSEVLFSLDGYEAQALDWYNNGGKFRGNFNLCMNANGWVQYVGINFGRYLYDTDFAFDPTRFVNPQLKISLSPSSGGGTPTNIYVSVLANVFDEKIPSLQGFLMAKELKQWETTSGAHEYTDLPTDYPYRALYLRPFLLDTEPTACVTNVKLSEDQDKRVPLNLTPIDIISTVMVDYPKCEEEYWYHITTTETQIYCAPSNFVTAVGSVHNETTVNYFTAFYSDGGGAVGAICQTGNFNVAVHIIGTLPHCVMEIPCGMKNDPADWWDVRNIGSLVADITGGATSAASLFLQQLRPY